MQKLNLKQFVLLLGLLLPAVWCGANSTKKEPIYNLYKINNLNKKL